MKLDEKIMMKHNLYEKYKEECIEVLTKYKPDFNGEYTSVEHDYLLEVAKHSDFKFYKHRKRGNLISCKYIADKLDRETEIKLKELNEETELHIIRTQDSPDATSFIKGMQKKLTTLGIGFKVIDIHNFNELDEYIDKYQHSKNPFIVVKPLNEIFNYEIEDMKTMLKDLDNYKIRDIDCFLGLFLSTKIKECKFGYIPTTVAAVVEIFKEFNITTKDYTHVCVLGQSKHLGGPISDVIEYTGFPVYVANSRTSAHIKEAILYSCDIVISVTGSPDICKLFNKKHVSTNEELSNRMIIDVGIVNDNGKIRGDIQNDIKAQYTIYNKVPGGVGLIDTSIVALRIVDAYNRQIKGDIK